MHGHRWTTCAVLVVLLVGPCPIGLGADSGGCRWLQVAKVVAEDGDPMDLLGHSVAIDAATLLVGAVSDESAYVFERDAGGADRCGQVAKLVPDDGRGRDDFGHAVSIDGGIAVVGAPRHGIYSYGAAYIFDRDTAGDDSWDQTARIDPGLGYLAHFGNAVSLDGRTLSVGTRFLGEPGQAWVYERDDGSEGPWDRIQQLEAPYRDYGDGFGASVSLSADRLAVGAADDEDALAGLGVVHVYERRFGGDHSWWVRTQQIVAADAAPNEHFGITVALSDETMVVCSLYYPYSEARSAIYVFELGAGGPGVWGPVAKLPTVGQLPYVCHLAISGDVFVVGAPGDHTEGEEAGAAYVYERDAGVPGGWSLTGRLVATDAAPDDHFGSAVAVNGGTIIVGTPHSDDYGESSGSAYVFEFGCTTCGNGIVEPGEQCDDGNTLPGDGCAPECHLESGACCITAEGLPACLFTSEDECALQNGQYRGMDVECIEDACVPAGCCTNGPGVASDCVTADRLDCEGGGGMYLGPGTECRPDVDCTALLVTMQAMSAEAVPGGVLVRWTTAQELDTVGFRVLRQMSRVTQMKPPRVGQAEPGCPSLG